MKIAIDSTLCDCRTYFNVYSKIAFNPKPAPTIFPILKASPPIPINIEMKVPRPPKISLATS